MEKINWKKKKNKKKQNILAIGMLICILSSIFYAPQMYKFGTQEVKGDVVVREAGASRQFVHPGMIHTAEGFVKIKQNIDNQVQPNLDTWNALLWDGFSSPNWNPRPLETVSRGVNNNYAQFYIDIRRAYQNALIYKISGSVQHGQAACRILNAWTDNMKVLTGNADRFLASGIYGYELANAAELMRDHSDFHKAEMEQLLLNIFYPMNKDFLVRHNDAHIGNYWANWDLCNIASMMSIGIFCDRQDIYEKALAYAKVGLGNGSLYNAMPYVYEDGTAQWQEAGRDQGHTTFGVGLWEVVCEMAWNQGDDLYGLSDNRFLKGAEYVARYNNGEDVLFSAYEWNQGQSGKPVWQTVVSGAGRGSNRPIYSMVYNHYVNRRGLSSPNVEKVLKDENGNWRIEGACTNGDELGWQTLTFANLSEPEKKKEIQGDFEDGVYRIRSILTRKSLVEKEKGTLSFAKAGLEASEWWTLKNIGDGEYRITNTVTNQVLQLKGDNLYAYGCQLGTGAASSAKDTASKLKQQFALLKNDSGDYRIVGSLNGFVLDIKDSNTEDNGELIQWRYHGAECQRWVLESREELLQKEEKKELLASIGFDNIAGLCGRGVKAQLNGKAVLSKDSMVGNSLYLDGVGSYVKLTDENGDSLLRGYKELTISYWSKTVSQEGTDWSFFAAPNDGPQTYLWENYVGVMEQKNNVYVQRYLNTGERPEDADLETVNNQWKYITVAFEKDKTVLYVDGVKRKEEKSLYPLEEIVGINGVCYIGKANWGTGEYYKGWIDEFCIYSYPVQQEQAKVLYQKALAAHAAYEEKLKGEDKGEGIKTAIGTCTIKSLSPQYYNGKVKRPGVSIFDKGKKLIEGKDYKVSYLNNKNIGTAKVVIAGIGNYTSQAVRTFSIKVKKNAVYKVGNYKYKVTSPKTNGKGAVSLVGVTKKKLKKLNVAASIKIGGKSFKITAVGKQAFKNCRKAVSLTIGKNVKTIGSKPCYNCKKLKLIKVKSKKFPKKTIRKKCLRGLPSQAASKIKFKMPKK